jgi:hypothetical protein
MSAPNEWDTRTFTCVDYATLDEAKRAQDRTDSAGVITSLSIQRMELRQW